MDTPSGKPHERGSGRKVRRRSLHGSSSLSASRGRRGEGDEAGTFFFVSSMSSVVNRCICSHRSISVTCACRTAASVVFVILSICGNRELLNSRRHRVPNAPTDACARVPREHSVPCRSLCVVLLPFFSVQDNIWRMLSCVPRSTPARVTPLCRPTHARTPARCDTTHTTRCSSSPFSSG